jgi:hypothetical protein
LPSSLLFSERLCVYLYAWRSWRSIENERDYYLFNQLNFTLKFINPSRWKQSYCGPTQKIQKINTKENTLPPPPPNLRLCSNTCRRNETRTAQYRRKREAEEQPMDLQSMDTASRWIIHIRYTLNWHLQKTSHNVQTKKQEKIIKNRINM